MIRPLFRWCCMLALSVPALAWCAESLQNEVELGTSHDTLDKGYANWGSYYLDGAHRFGERHSVYGELRQTDRFNLRDREISGGYYHPLAASWTALLEASVSPDHQVLPKDSLFGQLQKTLDDGWGIHVGLRHSRYNLAASDMAVLTGERYWGSYRASYKFYLSKLEGAGAAPSHNLQFSYYYADHDSITLSLANGRQVESLGAGLGVLTTKVTNISLSGRHWLDPFWGLSYELISERQGDLYMRKGIRVGIRYAF